MAPIIPVIPDIERAVLGAILHDPAIPNNAFTAVIKFEHLASTAFTIPEHKIIFSHMDRLYWEGKRPINPQTVTETLTAAGEIGRVGGRPYIAKLKEDAPGFYEGCDGEIQFACKVLKYARILVSQPQG